MADVKQFIFFDFEMLCSNSGMPFEEMEAIRLGAVKYELETREISYFDRYIRPQNQKPLSKFCRKLTGINDSDLNSAGGFKEVFSEFLYWIGGVKRSRFFSWSKNDLLRLKMDAEAHSIPQTTIDKFQKRYVDFQAIFTKRVTKTNFSVENALELYELPFIGEKHNPMWDSYNTLQIYLSFLNNCLKTDLIMVSQYILETVPDCVFEMNQDLRNAFNKDMVEFNEKLSDVFKMKDAYKIIKKTRKLVEKYENVLVNRSGIFSDEIIKGGRLLIKFYYGLLSSYKKHIDYSSKIIIVDEHSMQKLRMLSMEVV